jgi:hypothetical protein
LPLQTQQCKALRELTSAAYDGPCLGASQKVREVPRVVTRVAGRAHQRIRDTSAACRDLG